MTAPLSVLPPSESTSAGLIDSPDFPRRLEQPASVEHLRPKIEEDEDDGVSDNVTKCVCAFTDDLGASWVSCVNCDTWQHVECYYGVGKTTADAPEEHKCIDCEPRHVDRKTARTLQEALRADMLPEDRKIKKPPPPPPKSHRRKPKDGVSHSPSLIDDQQQLESVPLVERKGSSAKEQRNGTKRPKSNHRSTASSLATQTKSKSGHSAPNKASSHRGSKAGLAESIDGGSPAEDQYQAPDFIEELVLPYRRNYHAAEDPRLLNAYSDPALPDLIFRSLEAINSSSYGLSYLEYDEIIANLPQTTLVAPIKSLFNLGDVEGPWPALVLLRDVSVGQVIGELKGVVLHEQHYESSGRYDDLQSPEPYVFRHPLAPVVIDSRQMGTALRFMRRSCRPTVSVSTVHIESDIHFLVKSMYELPRGSEITVGWDLSAAMMSVVSSEYTLAKNQVVPENLKSQDHLELFDRWIRRLMQAFGGCGCGMDDQCQFSVIIQRVKTLLAPTSLAATPNHRMDGEKKGKVRKSKVPNATAANPKVRTISSKDVKQTPTSISRPGSEGPFSYPEPLQSINGSLPSSRDQTPLSPFPPGSLQSRELMSNREKRKLAALVIQFDKRQDEDEGPRKRKRHSGNSSANTPTASHLAHQMSPSIRTQRSPSVGPNQETAVSSASTSAMDEDSRSRKNSSSLDQRLTTAAPIPRYVDSGMQTEPVINAWHCIKFPQKRPPLLVTPAKRLLMRALEYRRSQEAESEKRKEETPVSTDENMQASSPASVPSTPSFNTDAMDIDEKDDLPSQSTRRRLSDLRVQLDRAQIPLTKPRPPPLNNPVANVIPPPSVEKSHLLNGGVPMEAESIQETPSRAPSAPLRQRASLSPALSPTTPLFPVYTRSPSHPSKPSPLSHSLHDTSPEAKQCSPRLARSPPPHSTPTSTQSSQPSANRLSGSPTSLATTLPSFLRSNNPPLLSRMPTAPMAPVAPMAPPLRRPSETLPETLRPPSLAIPTTIIEQSLPSPNPVKKKMSLSDYSAMKAKEVRRSVSHPGPTVNQSAGADPSSFSSSQHQEATDELGGGRPALQLRQSASASALSSILESLQTQSGPRTGMMLQGATMTESPMMEKGNAMEKWAKPP